MVLLSTISPGYGGIFSRNIIADTGEGLIRLYCGSGIQDTPGGWSRLGRDRVRLWVGLLTWHNTLPRHHLSHINVVNDSRCRNSDLEEETFSVSVAVSWLEADDYCYPNNGLLYYFTFYCVFFFTLFLVFN